MGVAAAMVAGIGASHRVEGGDDVHHFCAQADQHRADHMIPQDQDVTIGDFRREMTVPDMPGEFGKVPRIACAHGIERFLGCNDLDMATTLQEQNIVVSQRNCFWKIDEQRLTAAEINAAAAKMPAVMIEHRPRTG